MLTTKPLVLSAAFVAMTSACATTIVPEPEPSEIPDPSAPTTLEQLQRGLVLQLVPDSSILGVQLLWNQGSTEIESELDLTVLSGHVLVQADSFGIVHVESLELQIADQRIHSEELAEDLEIVDIAVGMDQGQDCDVNDWSEDRNHASSSMQTELGFDWSMKRDGVVTPLGGQSLRELPMELSLSSTTDGVHLDIAIDSEGTVWSWLGLVELSDVSFYLEASELGGDY